ncbi:MAG TPA: hypothetical protein VG406_03095 [Isosphaeraceae bacterium]|jgi:hypothetical protein|nr:hypothetical protein [Isosphaeraceae bacterium]
MVQLARARGALIAIATVVAAVVAVDGAATALVGDLARALTVGERPTDWWVVERAGRVVAALTRAEGREPVGPARPGLGVVLGQSTALAGIDPRVLMESDRGRRWANLSGVGGSVFRIAYMDRLLEESRLRPDVVVIAINPYMIFGTPERALRAAEYRRNRNRIKPWVWTWENRPLLNLMLRPALYEVRRALFTRLGYHTEDFFAPEPDPFAQRRGDPAVKPLSPAELAGRLEFNRQLGWYAPESYGRPSDAGMRTLEALIRRHRDLGAEVVLVLMPERSPQRDATPPVALDRIRSLNTGPFRERPVPILELRDAVPDDDFNDLDHLSHQGRAITSRRLAERLKGLLPNPSRR